MKNKLPIVLIIGLFAVLTAVYFRHAIWSPADALVTKHLATDLYAHFAHVWESLKLLGQGFVPIGDYWVQRGGGYPAAHFDQLMVPQDLLLMLFYVATNSFATALKFADITFYFATLVMAYWFGKVLFKRRDASVILAVAYTFSVYGANQLEHPELLGVQPFILLTLIFLEKTLQSGKPLYIILTSLGLLLVWLSQPYPLYFLLVFIAFRLTFQLLTTPRRLETLYRVSKVGVLSALLTTPFLLLQLSYTPSEHFLNTVIRQGLLATSQPPSLYFIRNVPYEPYHPEIYFMYLGLSVLALALVPTIVKHSTNKLYLFYLLVTAFFMLYAVGQYGPVNLALWFQEHMPFAQLLRVPGRALVIGYLSLAVCAAFGSCIVFDSIKHLRWKYAAALLIPLAIFADLAIGFEPTTMTEPPRPTETYQFLKSQPEDFRIVEVPSIHGQQASTLIYTEHDTLNPVLWAFGHFDPLYTFGEVYRGYAQQSVTAQEAALYGVKYVVVNTDPQYFVTFEKALEYSTIGGGPNLLQTRKVDRWLSKSDDYRLVYNEDYTNVYENLLYRGIVFSNEAVVRYERRDPNTLIIDYNSTTPTTLTISQSYAEGWVAKLDGEVKLPVYEYNSIQRIDVPAGSHTITLHYQNYERWWLTLAAFYTILALAIWWLLRRRPSVRDAHRKEGIHDHHST